MMNVMKEPKTQRNAASAAVIDLRKALGMTQQRFAVEALESALNTVARYETTNPPSGEALLRLAKIAEENSLSDLAARFRRLNLDEKLSHMPNLVIDAQAETGWLLMRLHGRKQIEEAIDFYEKHRTSPKDEPSWLAWKNQAGHREKARKRY